MSGSADEVDWRYKSFPLREGVRIDTVAEQRWQLLGGEFTFPVLAVRRDAVAHNLRVMSEYCRTEGVELAPHGKTHMSPQLWERQREGGAVAVTVANIAQARVFAAHGARAILIANEVIDPQDLAGIQHLRADGVAVTIVIDSFTGVAVAEAVLAADPAAEPIDALLELGYDGGRAGIRSQSHALALARAVHASPGVVLRGVEGFEGVMPGLDEDGRRAGVRRYLEDAVTTLAALAREGLVTEPAIASFGGSMYPELVVQTLREASGLHGLPLRVVLRSGCYLTHDHGQYADAIGTLGGSALRPALELWARVLSRPEPRLAIIGAGRRDVPYDSGLPVALRRHAGGVQTALSGVRATGINDQHLYLSLDQAEALDVGDLVCFGISHPCTAFDKWRLIPEIDDDYRVVGAIRTFF